MQVMSEAGQPVPPALQDMAARGGYGGGRNRYAAPSQVRTLCSCTATIRLRCVCGAQMAWQVSTRQAA